MRRVFACIVALMVCAAMVLPVAASTFTPSVTNKPAPRIVPMMDPDGNPVWGEILEDGVVIDYLYEGCLIVTSVADAPTSTEIPDDSEDLLLSVYSKLQSGEMKLPYDKLGLKEKNAVIRDLFDATFVCGDADSLFAVDHPEVLEPEGVVLRITFDLGVAATDKIHTMTYKDGQWNPIVKTVNNGDGTVTCTFEKLCPVVFVMETAEDTPVDPPKTGDPAGENMIVWIITAAASLVAIAALVVIYRVKFSKK